MDVDWCVVVSIERWLYRRTADAHTHTCTRMTAAKKTHEHPPHHTSESHHRVVDGGCNVLADFSLHQHRSLYIWLLSYWWRHAPRRHQFIYLPALAAKMVLQYPLMFLPIAVLCEPPWPGFTFGQVANWRMDIITHAVDSYISDGHLQCSCLKRCIKSNGHRYRLLDNEYQKRKKQNFQLLLSSFIL